MGGSEKAKTALSYSQFQRTFQVNTRSLFFYVLFLSEVRRDHVPIGCGQWKLYFIFAELSAHPNCSVLGQ
jgi:hypothetical protein